VAIKIYPKFKLNDAHKKRAVVQEIACMKKLSHPYICKLLDHFESGKEIYLVQEYVSGISLYQYLKNKGCKQIPVDQAHFFIRQLSECFKYLHSFNQSKESICHRDLKLENVIVDDRNNIKLIDFGFATSALHGQMLKTCCGTPSYMAPK
jgi:serine/threonine protein kinase